MKLVGVLSMLTLPLLPFAATAGDVPEESLSRAQALEQARSLATTGNSEAGRVAKKAELTHVPGFQGTEVPEATLYENGAALEDKARAALADHPVGRFVEDSAYTRPQFQLDRDDPVVARGDAIAKDPEATLGQRLEATYRGCETVATETAPATYTEARCTAWGMTLEGQCSRTLDVTCQGPKPCAGDGGGIVLASLAGDMRWQYAYPTLTIGTVANNDWGGSCAVYDRRTTFTIRDISKIATFRLMQTGFDDWIRIVLNGHPVYIGPYGGDRLEVERVGRAGQRVRYTGAAHGPCELGTRWVKPLDLDLKPYLRSGENTLDLRVIVSGHGEGGLTLQASQYCGCQWAEHWRHDCGTLEADTAQGRCARQSTICTAPNQTRTIHGESVHRDCWQYDTHYLCASGEIREEPECPALRSRGCDPIGSACLSTLPDKRCAAYEQTYRCPDRSPTTRTVLNCGDQTFCLEGDCFEAGYAPSSDFGLAASHLGAIDALADDFDRETLRLFKGGGFNCAKSVAGFQNCCKDNGWGVDIGLAHCSAEEETLAAKRSEGLCHFVGSYCSVKVPVIGTCLEQKAAHCCFTSKLARIIQEQGRTQLGIGWGNPEQPECRGFTPEEIQRIDWEAIDFSEFYADALQQAQAGRRPSPTELEAHIKDRVTRLLP